MSCILDTMSKVGYIKNMDLKNKLKLMRLVKGDITQEELANRVGCSRQTINSVENGKFVPSIKLVLTIAKVLEVSVEDIFFLDKGESE